MTYFEPSPQEPTPDDNEASIYTGPIVMAYMAGSLALSGAVELGLGAPEQVTGSSFITAASLVVGALGGAFWAHRHRHDQ